MNQVTDTLSFHMHKLLKLVQHTFKLSWSHQIQNHLGFLYTHIVFDVHFSLTIINKDLAHLYLVISSCSMKRCSPLKKRNTDKVNFYTNSTAIWVFPTVVNFLKFNISKTIIIHNCKFKIYTSKLLQQ